MATTRKSQTSGQIVLSYLARGFLEHHPSRIHWLHTLPYFPRTSVLLRSWNCAKEGRLARSSSLHLPFWRACAPRATGTNENGRSFYNCSGYFRVGDLSQMAGLAVPWPYMHIATLQDCFGKVNILVMCLKPCKCSQQPLVWLLDWLPLVSHSSLLAFHICGLICSIMRCMTPLGVKGHLKVRGLALGAGVCDAAALTVPGLCVCPHSASHYNVRFQLIIMEKYLLIIYVNVAVLLPW